MFQASHNILLFEGNIPGIYKRLAMKKKLLEKMIIIRISYSS